MKFIVFNNVILGVYSDSGVYSDKCRIAYFKSCTPGVYSDTGVYSDIGVYSDNSTLMKVKTKRLYGLKELFIITIKYNNE